MTTFRWTKARQARLIEIRDKYQRLTLACLVDELGCPEEVARVRLEKPAKSTAPKGSKRRGRSKSGGFREDIGMYCRSSWEHNVILILRLRQTQGLISEWHYEPDTFRFPVKRGVLSYTPDFRVHYPDGTSVYQEVKGYMNQRSRTALERMAKFHPEHTIIVIDTQAYRALEIEYAGMFPNWEGKRIAKIKGDKKS